MTLNGNKEIVTNGISRRIQYKYFESYENKIHKKFSCIFS